MEALSDSGELPDPRDLPPRPHQCQEGTDGAYGYFGAWYSIDGKNSIEELIAEIRKMLVEMSPDNEYDCCSSQSREDFRFKTADGKSVTVMVFYATDPFTVSVIVNGIEKTFSKFSNGAEDIRKLITDTIGKM